MAWFLRSPDAVVGVLGPDLAVECPRERGEVGPGLDEVRPDGEALDRRRGTRGSGEMLNPDPESDRGLVGGGPASGGVLLVLGDACGYPVADCDAAVGNDDVGHGADVDRVGVVDVEA